MKILLYSLNTESKIVEIENTVQSLRAAIHANRMKTILLGYAKTNKIILAYKVCEIRKDKISGVHHFGSKRILLCDSFAVYEEGEEGFVDISQEGISIAKREILQVVSKKID